MSEIILKEESCRLMGIKIVFFGTPEFAGDTLKKLNEADFCKVVGIVTAPDKPVGRKQVLTPTPVKVAAQELGVPVWQPEKLKNNQEIVDQLKKFEIDLFIVIAYGKIIPKIILDIPRRGALNVHYSLLPKYRGAAPVQFALLNDESETGVSIMLLDEEMDHGPIVAKQESKIAKHESSEDLFRRLAKVGDKLLLEIIPKYMAGEIKPVEQDHTKATYTKIINKKDGLVDWSKNAEKIFNQWRAFQPWPGIYTKAKIKNKEFRIKLLKIKIFTGQVKDHEKIAGEFCVIDDKLLIRCGDDSSLEILELQIEGKKPMTVKEFINGYVRF